MAKAQTTVLNPLTANDLAGVAAGIQSLQDLNVYLDKCTNCTLDVQSMRDQAAALLDYFQRVQQEFGSTGNV